MSWPLEAAHEAAQRSSRECLLEGRQQSDSRGSTADSQALGVDRLQPVRLSLSPAQGETVRPRCVKPARPKVSRLLATQIASGQQYARLKPVVGVHWLDFDLFEGHPSSRWHFEMRDRQDPKVRLGDEGRCCRNGSIDTHSVVPGLSGRSIVPGSRLPTSTRGCTTTMAWRPVDGKLPGAPAWERTRRNVRRRGRSTPGGSPDELDGSTPAWDPCSHGALPQVPPASSST